MLEPVQPVKGATLLDYYFIFFMVGVEIPPTNIFEKIENVYLQGPKLLAPHAVL